MHGIGCRDPHERVGFYALPLSTQKLSGKQIATCLNVSGVQFRSGAQVDDFRNFLGEFCVEGCKSLAVSRSETLDHRHLAQFHYDGVQARRPRTSANERS